jgi:hypothetical protein
MRRLNPAKAALAVGIVIGLYHLAWVGLVASGLAKAFLDFVLRLHFIQLDYQLASFDVATGAMLVALTFAIGALFGLVFAFVWNWLAAKPDGGAS